MKLLRFAALASILCMLPTLVLAQDEVPGQQLPITLNVGQGGFNCGRDSSPLYCYGIPVAINGQPSGTFWIDTYLTGYNAGTGFIVWNNVADLDEAHVTGDSETYATFTGTNNGRPVSISAPATVVTTFSGDTNDGDGGSYSGSMSLNFTYYYSSGGGGRGGAAAGWRLICTGGTISIKYNN